MTGRVTEAAAEGRALCLRCRRPGDFCVCRHVPSVDHRTPVLIVQHKKEHPHPFNTARLARLALRRSELHLVREGADPIAPPAGAALLFPGPGSVDLHDLPPARRPRALVVIDGTWRQATRLFRDQAWLRELPQVRLQPAEPSRYRVRRAPRQDYISTIESIASALKLIEPENEALDELLRPFDAMIDEQLEYLRVHGRRPRHKRRATRFDPAARLRDQKRLVLCFAEGVTVDEGRRRLVCLDASRVIGDEAPVRLVRRRDEETARPTDCHLAEMRLSRRDIDAGAEPVALARRWNDFRRPGDVLVSWNRDTFRLLDDTLREAAAPPDDAERVALKEIWGRVHGRARGDLPEVATGIGASFQRDDRPAEWLAATRCLLDHLLHHRPASTDLIEATT